MIDEMTEPLMRLFLGLLLFRLGGEQTFTPAEMDEIKQTVAGVSFFVTEDGRLGARTRGPLPAQKAIEDGYAL